MAKKDYTVASEECSGGESAEETLADRPEDWGRKELACAQGLVFKEGVSKTAAKPASMIKAKPKPKHRHGWVDKKNMGIRLPAAHIEYFATLYRITGLPKHVLATQTD